MSSRSRVVSTIVVLITAVLLPPIAAHAVASPGRPPGVAATSLNSAIRVTWKAAAPNGSPVTRYDVQTRRRSPSTGTWSGWSSHLVGGAARAFKFGAPNGSLNEARVRARNSGGWGAFSRSVRMMAGLPTAPAGLTVTPGEHRFGVAWKAAGGNGSPIQSYKVSTRYRKGGGWTAWAVKVLPGSARTSTYKGLPEGRRYEVEVRATNKYGAGPATPRRGLVVRGPAVALSIVVQPPAQPFGARDVVVSARDSTGNVAVGYRGTVTFTKFFGQWSTPAQEPDDTQLPAADFEGAIPADYAFTAADAGRRTIVGGWSTEMPGRWGLHVTDVDDGTIAGKTEVDQLSTVQVKNGRVRLTVGWEGIYVVEALASNEMDPTESGATLEVYDTSNHLDYVLPGPGGIAKFDLPPEGWEIFHPVGTGGYGYEYTGDPVTGCASVKIVWGKITADCSAAGLNPPFLGNLAVYIVPGGDALDGAPALHCPNYGGAEFKQNSASGILVESKQLWGDTPVKDLCLDAGDDFIYVSDPVNTLTPAPSPDAYFTESGDTWALDVLDNDVNSNPVALTWSVDIGWCNPIKLGDFDQYEEGFGCGFLAPNSGPSSYLDDNLWGHVFPPWSYIGILFGAERNSMIISSQPECGFYINGPPSEGDPASGSWPRATTDDVSCTFEEELGLDYWVSDYLHKSRGHVTMNYATPQAPDYSEFDPEEAQATVTTTEEGLQILSPEIVGGSLMVPYGTTVPLTQVSMITEEAPVVGGYLTFECNTCMGGAIVIDASMVQPSLAIDLIQGGEAGDLVLNSTEVRVEQPLVVSSYIPPVCVVHQDPPPTHTVCSPAEGDSPFMPVLTVDPTEDECTELYNCVTTEDQHVYASALTKFDPFELVGVCEQYGGVFLLGGVGLPDWTCQNVGTNQQTAAEAFIFLDQFCYQQAAYWSGLDVKCGDGDPQ